LLKNKGIIQSLVWLIFPSGQLVLMWYCSIMSNPQRQTEVIEAHFAGIDTWSDGQILDALLAGQERAIAAVRRALPAISQAANAIAERMKIGGTLYYAGAGTSIRVGVQDGSELPATFGIDEAQLGYFIAGDKPAIFESMADKEDSVEDGRNAARICTRQDALIAIAASGRTPYSIAAAAEAKARGCLVVSVINVPGSDLGKAAEIEIVLQSGAEVIAGSTRMGAGTAQKAALNLMSTLLGIKLNAVYDGMMIAMRPQNEKLQERAAIIIAQIADVKMEAARAALAEAGAIKPAVLLCAGAISLATATQLLAGTDGNLRLALAQLDRKQNQKPQH
jgi:N-acetylmuramic acid 6-phosphate etherase